MRDQPPHAGAKIVPDRAHHLGWFASGVFDLPVDAAQVASKRGRAASGGGTAFFLRADGDWCTHIVAKSTTPSASDYGLASIPTGAIWVQTA